MPNASLIAELRFADGQPSVYPLVSIPAMESMSVTRDKIIKAASSLFYREGIRSISVDAIAEKAGLTKRSLYYHFKSKDDLIEAYLKSRDKPNLDTFEKWYEETQGDAGKKVRAIFTNLARSARSPRWKGCGFLRMSAELVAMPGHPALKAANEHKAAFERWLGERLESAGAIEPSGLAQQVRLLLDGAFSVVLLNRNPSYMEVAGEAAQTLIDTNLAARRQAASKAGDKAIADM